MVLKVIIVVLAVILIGCFVYVVHHLSKLNSAAQRSSHADMMAFEAATRPEPTATDDGRDAGGEAETAGSASPHDALARTTPVPNSTADDSPTDAPLPGEPAAKDQMVAKEEAVVSESTTRASAASEPVTEDTAVQSTGVAEKDKVHGKTISMSAFDFEQLLSDRNKQKKKNPGDENG